MKIFAGLLVQPSRKRPEECVTLNLLGMKYINFITDSRVLKFAKGSTEQEIAEMENELSLKIPTALEEYLLIMGEATNLYEYWDEHGTKDIFKLNGWLHNLIEGYRKQGIALEEIKSILPFFNFQDTYFYVPIEEGNENPPVYAFDVNEKPTIRKLENSFADFVKSGYYRKLATA